MLAVAVVLAALAHPVDVALQAGEVIDRLAVLLEFVCQALHRLLAAGFEIPDDENHCSLPEAQGGKQQVIADRVHSEFLPDGVELFSLWLVSTHLNQPKEVLRVLGPAEGHLNGVDEDFRDRVIYPLEVMDQGLLYVAESRGDLEDLLELDVFGGDLDYCEDLVSA